MDGWGERESGDMLNRGQTTKSEKMERADVLFLQPTEEALRRRGDATRVPDWISNPGVMFMATSELF